MLGHAGAENPDITTKILANAMLTLASFERLRAPDFYELRMLLG